MNDRPVRLVVDDDRRRSRLTVFFRLFLAIPHFFWLALWTFAVFFTAIAQWFVTVVRARPADPLQSFHVAYIRYATHVGAYLCPRRESRSRASSASRGTRSTSSWTRPSGSRGSRPRSASCSRCRRSSSWRS